MIRTLCIASLFTCLVTGVVAGQSANDDCANAIPVTSGTTTPFDTTLDTNDGPAQGCNAGGAFADIWFIWTASCDGTALIDNCGSAYDTVITAYAPGVACPPTALDEIACDDFSCGFNSSINFPCVSGSSYLICVSGWNGEVGAGVLNVDCLPAGIPNDECANALPITSGTPENFATIGATQDGPPGSCNSGAAPDIWYTWTADCDGNALITTCGSAFDTVLNVYAPGSVCPPTAADEIGCSDLGCGGVQSEVSFPCTLGTTYLVQVTGWGGAIGTGTLNASCIPGDWSTMTAAPRSP